MKTVTAFVKNNSFFVFVLLAYLLSWWLVPLNAGMLPVGPLLAALLVVGLSEGKAGVKVWWRLLALGLLALDGPHLGRKQVLHAEIPHMSQQLAQK